MYMYNVALFRTQEKDEVTSFKKCIHTSNIGLEFQGCLSGMLSLYFKACYPHSTALSMNVDTYASVKRALAL